ncbi:MAG: VWA domain-containing protein [Rhizobiales bacterium]|nr:VWA domain-containing protein [Hyphomicrobiales bacterium]MBI3674331.1 VWA domain-containing protein [Hyphomicrobiales bacterium]
MRGLRSSLGILAQNWPAGIKTSCRTPAGRGFFGFLGDCAGNITMMSAISAIPVVVIAGASIDYARITADSAAFSAAVDSALVAVVASDRASLTGLSGGQTSARMAELTTFATSYVKTNYQSSTAVEKSISVSLAITDSDVTITAKHTLPTSLMSLAGISDLQETLTSTIKKAARPVELVMVMDTTGSMGTTYMAQARTAAHNLMNKIYGGTATAKPDSPNIRVGLVPFSAAVRLNTSAYDFNWSWIDTAGNSSVSRLNFSDPSWHNYFAWTKLSNTAWNGCVEARPAGAAPFDYNTNDDPPTSGDSLFVPYFAPDEPSVTGSGFYNSYIGNTGTPNETTGLASTSTASSNWLNRQNNVNKYTGVTITSESSSSYGPWFNCDKTAIVPLTHNRAHVETGIDAMTADGSTVIPEGLAWGWRVLSPTAPFTKVEAGPSTAADAISGYNNPRWRKIMVLMTDGENDVLSNGNEINTLNGTWYSSYGRGKATAGNRFGTTTSSSTGAALDTAMLTLCSNIKAKGVEIYTVAFRVTKTNIQNNLKTCATDAAHYSFAADGVALGTVFNSIGLNVQNSSVYLSK